jgi:GntR family transcriptional regulator, transcriptional repressor for pyruvate dehydrogenase complex
MSTAVSRQTLTDQVADGILELIFQNELGAGDSLPSSGELAKRFDVSVVVVREALALLAGRGILNRRQGRESVVALPGHRELSSTLKLRAKQELIPPEEFLQCRAWLETQATVLAAEHEPAEERERAIAAALERMEKARTNQEMIEADLAFHAELAALSGNRALILILASLHSVIRDELERRTARQTAKDRATSLDRHRPVAEAVVAGDRAAARRAMVEHFQHAVPDVDLGLD